MEPIKELAELSLEIDKRRGKEDAAFFIERFLCIRDILNPDQLTVPFILFPKQKEALQSINDNRLNIILKARQLGLTWLALGWSIRKMYYNEGITGLVTSRAEIEVAELMNRYEFMLKNAPELFRDIRKKDKDWTGVYYEKNALSVKLLFPSGEESRVIGFPSNKNSGISFTGSFWLADEWAKQDYAEGIFTSLYPAVNNPNSKFIGLSTIERGSFFEQKWIEDNNFNKIFLPWDSDPRRDETWYNETQDTMKERMTSEYPATVEEALTVPGGAFFPEYDATIHICPVKDIPKECTRYISIDYGLDMLAAYWYAVYPDGKCLIYRELAQKDLVDKQAAEAVKTASAGEHITQIFAPKDLWHRNATGKTTAEAFDIAGVPLTRADNAVEQGLRNVKDWLLPKDIDGKLVPKLQIMKNTSPNLENSLKNIQKDKNNPNITAKQPHKLTHFIDSLRYFASGRPVAITPDDDDSDDYESLFNYGR